MKRTIPALIAGAAGISLLLAGGTFALWSDSELVDGASITAGRLDLELAATEWWDISADRTSSPHQIDLDTFRIIPGDTIEGRYIVSADLVGENLVAELGIATVSSGSPANDFEQTLLYNLSLYEAFQVTEGEGDDEHQVWSLGEDPIASGKTMSITTLFASEDNGDPGTLPVMQAGQYYAVVIRVAFPLTDTGHMDDIATLAATSLTLRQVRAAADGYVN